MKVLDLQCALKHVFEGWFSSEDDFISQCERNLVECPVCGNASISKKLSAPRLMLKAVRSVEASEKAPAAGARMDVTLQAAWMLISSHIVANTDNVGERFAEEARKIYYGETSERAIRGQASPAETEALLEEGIAVIPLLLPDVLKGTLQ